MAVGERRIARRVPVKLVVTEEFHAEQQDVAAVNISEHGMHYYRPTDASRHTKREVLLTFSLVDRLQPIKALAWVVEEREVDGRIASHVTFMFLPEKDEEVIRQYVQSRSAH
ncbi:MAG TPA: PilZ domain-containing protein [Desulfopila sp.]|nr:PilZ domain-containing protein [Desulfopila sp.]